MRVEWRKRGEQGPPLGIIFGAVLVLAAVAAAIWLSLGLPVPRCTLRELTGIPCPTCGSTRMVRALLRGDVFEAVRLNPLVFAVLSAVASWAVASAVVRKLGLAAPVVRLEGAERWLLRIAAILLLIAGWAYVIWLGE